MAPKRIAFDESLVLTGAMDVVRRKGLDGLTARAAAGRLRSSVAPVYRAFRSMKGLERAVLEESRRIMDDMTRRAWTDIPFLNIGVGIAVFARDESRLFQALFLSKHHSLDIVESFRESVLDRMREDALLRLLPDARLRRLLESIWLFTLGLGSAVVYGHLPDAGTDEIIRRLKDMGSVLMFAEVSGLADSDSPESDREWERQIREKGIVLPTQEGAHPPACPKRPKEES
jgi:AcrR family transcriptional regulator